MSNRLEEFKTWLILERNLSGGTVKRHTWTLNQTLKNVNDNFNYSGLTAYLLLKKEQGCRHTYLNHIVGTSRVYTLFLQAKNYPHDPAILTIKDFKKQPYERATLADGEIEAFLSLPQPTRRQIVRTRWGKTMVREWHGWDANYEKYTMFFRCLAFSACRPHEMAQMRVEEVDWGRNCFLIHEYKTGHQGQTRYVPIAENLKEPLKAYMDKLKGDYLFPTYGNHSSKRQYINNTDWCAAFQNRLKRLGIKRRNLTVYSFRHSMATRLVEEDVSLFKVMKLLGHRNIKTTEIYAHMSTKDVEKAIAKHPLVMKQTDPKLRIKALEELIDAMGFSADPRFKVSKNAGNGVFSFSVELVDGK